MNLIAIAFFVIGLSIVGATLFSVIQTFVLPRAASDFIAGSVFRSMRRVFMLRVRKSASYEQRDRVMALYAPISLMMLPPTWLVLIGIGYTFMFRSIGVESWQAAFRTSGSSLFTLGFAPLETLPQQILGFTEAAIGLIMVALFISYLPTMYSAFQRREQQVALLEVRAGSPPSAIEMIARYSRLHGLESLVEVWRTWEVWFTDIEESHTSLAALVFFRSPQADHSWVTAAGAVLDAAALCASTLDVPRNAQTDLCLRAGYIALRRIADYFHVPYNSAPKPDDPISISREEFDAAYDQLAMQSIPLKPDRDDAWKHFSGWRVNYDTVLLALASITMAPYAPWSSDRSIMLWKHSNKNLLNRSR
jgi:hypothetical protein